MQYLAVVFVVLEGVFLGAAVSCLMFLAYDGSGYYNDAVRDWSAVVANLMMLYISNTCLKALQGKGSS